MESAPDVISEGSVRALNDHILALRSRVAVLEKVLGNVEQYVAAWAFEYRSKPSSEHNDAQLKLIAKSLKDMRTALSGEAG